MSEGKLPRLGQVSHEQPLFCSLWAVPAAQSAFNRGGGIAEGMGLVKCHLGNPPHEQELCCTDALGTLCETSCGSNVAIQMHTWGRAAGKQLCREPEAHCGRQADHAPAMSPCSLLGCIRQNIASRLREVILLFCSEMDTCLECCVQS